MAKEISRKEYLSAMALFIVASRKVRELDAIESEMNEILSEENGSHISDALYGSKESSEKEFQLALKRADIIVTK